MSWKIALVVALLTGVITAVITAPVADRMTKLHGVSDFEGGRGMAIAFLFIPAGLIGGFLFGILGTKLVHATEWVHFWKATGVSVLMSNVALFGISGISLLGIPRPPTLDGYNLVLDVEVLVPIMRIPSGMPDPQHLRMSLYAGDKDNQYATIDTAHIRVENGYVVVPATVDLNSRAHFRMFSFQAEKTISLALDPLLLPASPSAKDLEWSDPTPMREASITGSSYTYTDVLLRFRVVKGEREER